MNRSFRQPFCVSYQLLANNIVIAVNEFKSFQCSSPTIPDLSRMLNVSEESILEAMEFNHCSNQTRFQHTSWLVC
jgi:hypothetical protein